MVPEITDKIILNNMSSFNCQEYIIYLRSSLGMEMEKAILNQKRRLIQNIEDRLRKLNQTK